MNPSRKTVAPIVLGTVVAVGVAAALLVPKERDSVAPVNQTAPPPAVPPDTSLNNQTVKPEAIQKNPDAYRTLTVSIRGILVKGGQDYLISVDRKATLLSFETSAGNPDQFIGKTVTVTGITGTVRSSDGGESVGMKVQKITP